jgi:hypothetical protein
MSHFTGANLVVQFKGTVISGDQTDWKDKETGGLVDTSAGADAAKTYLATLLDGDAKFSARYKASSTAATDPYNLLAPLANGTLIISPEGTASGKPKKTINSAFVKDRDRSLPYADNAEINATFQYSAAPSDGTW